MIGSVTDRGPALAPESRLKMKKRVFCLILFFGLLASLCGFAGEDMSMKAEGKTLILYAPETVETVFVSFDGTVFVTPFSQEPAGEGLQCVKWCVPEELWPETPLFTAAAVMPEGTRSLMALVGCDDEGVLYVLGVSRTIGEMFVDLSEGYEVSEGRTLYVRLPGSPYTGYEWTFVPDDSGTCFLAEEMEVNMTVDQPEDVITDTASGYFFLPEPDAPGREGSVMFERTLAPEGAAPAGQLIVRYTLNEAGEFEDFSMELIQAGSV